MGCASSKKQKQMENGGCIYNKDVDVKKKLLTGVQMSKDADGMEANFQIAFWRKSRKKYERADDKIPLMAIEEEKELKTEITEEES